jgi:hypothetical protein
MITRKRRRSHSVVTAAILMLVLALSSTSLAANQAQSSPAQAQQRVLVLLHDWAPPGTAVGHEYAQRHGGRLLRAYEHALNGFAAELPAPALATLSNDPRVAHVELDQRVEIAGEIPTGLDRIGADQYHDLRNPDRDPINVDIDVAILDTGIAEHPDLNVVGGVDCSLGFWIFIRCDEGVYPDGHGHGTHVAGTVGALDNGAGVVGVAPGARLWGVKVLDDGGSGWISNIAAGIDWVTARAEIIDVANMSLGCECASAVLDTAITNSTNAGVVYVVAAGNSDKDAATFSPANHPRTIAVSALADYDGKPGGLAAPTCSDRGPDDTLATFSNYGPTVDIAAPGVCINSTVPGGGFAQWSGTSMASPHVAGAAALYILEHDVPRSSNRWSQVRIGLITGWSVSQGHECGYLNTKSNEPLLMLADCEGSGDDDDVAVGSVGGIVTSVAGDPIQGATVRATRVDGVGQYLGSTDATGSYSIANIPEGAYDLTAAADGYLSQTEVNVAVAANETAGVHFTLQLAPPTTGSVAGVVRNSASNEPISGASVVIGKGAFIDLLITGADGAFSFEDLEPGAYEFASSASGFITRVGSFEVVAGETTVFDILLDPEGSSGQIDVIWVTLQRSPDEDSYRKNQWINYTVSVSEYFSGNPIGNAAISWELQHADGGVFYNGSGSTDSSGTFTFRTRARQNDPSGTYILTVIAERSGYATPGNAAFDTVEIR